MNGNSDVHGLPAHVAGLYLTLMRTVAASRDTRELDFSHHRQMFLTEQGYSYGILDAADLLTVRKTG